ncbi:hypothetical protein ACUN7V_07555 [Quadrisphaera oryzae]|uniref:hypothetical protein n=1 Tax=Quadrisphaera TaxID=317661 RepID=UPI00164598BA|nr:hypothetical protein [Quadrisphaera sp. RL12-1S]MBC3763248.1 hypothetical protein [Quadrisphaera sp. RL12-1S]
MFGALAGNPLPLLLGLVLPLVAAMVGVVVLYGVVRLAVRHGAADADRLQRPADRAP